MHRRGDAKVNADRVTARRAGLEVTRLPFSLRWFPLQG